MGVFAYYTQGESTITKCTNNMNITLSGAGNTQIGGIVYNAFSTPNISNNTNNGNLKANNTAGGIIGYTNAIYLCTIEWNKNYGSIITTNNTDDSYAGGIIGYLDHTTSATPTISNNLNFGYITSFGISPACGIASGYEKNTGFSYSAVKDRRPAFNLQLTICN